MGWPTADSPLGLAQNRGTVIALVGTRHHGTDIALVGTTARSKARYLPQVTHNILIRLSSATDIESL